MLFYTFLIGTGYAQKKRKQIKLKQKAAEQEEE